MKCISCLIVLCLCLIDMQARDPFNIPGDKAFKKEQKKNRADLGIEKSSSSVHIPSEWELVSTSTQSLIFKNPKTGDMRIVDTREEQETA